MTNAEPQPEDEKTPGGASSTSLKGFVVVLGVAAGLVLFYLGLRRSPALLAVALTLAAKLAADGLARGTASARLRASTALACAFAGVALGHDLWSRLPRTPTPPGLDRLGEVFQLAGTLASVAFVLLAFGAALLGAYLFFWLTRLPVRSGVLRYAGLLAITVLAALSLLGVVRTATRPSPERYLADVMSGSTAPSPPPGCVRVLAARTPPEETRREVEDLVVVSRCGTFESCDLGVFARESPPAAGDWADLRFSVPTCAAFEVTRLAPDLVLVRAAWQESRAYESPVFRDALFRRRGGRWALSPDEDLVAGKASPPRSWIACGLVGLALALAARRRRAASLRGGQAQASEDELVRWGAWALAISTVTAAPLVAAAMAGLLR
jgi:hypothetical protein